MDSELLSIMINGNPPPNDLQERLAKMRGLATSILEAIKKCEDNPNAGWIDGIAIDGAILIQDASDALDVWLDD